MKSDLPNASQFSPVQTPLPELLRIVQAHEPDRRAVPQAILQAFFSGRGDRTTWDWKLADNTIIAMSQYGLLNKPKGDQTHVSLTDLGKSLAEKASRGDDRELYDEFVRHILLNLRGLEVVACVDDLIASGQTPTKALLVKELRHRGIYHPPNGTHANGMRQWFETAGLVRKGEWEVNKDLLREILGVGMDTLTAYGSLTKE